MALRDLDPAEVGGYRIEDRLGSGGIGVVYLARSASGRPLAIKVVHGQYADDDEFRARFRREVAAARQVSGAFTAPVVDADADAPRPWMATLYIPGADLGTHVREHGPLPLPRLRELAAGLAEALRDMHRAGVVHRDLKPANVMLADDGPRVIDFGISRAAEFAASDVLTQTGRVMGTPPFMSPEQFASPPGRRPGRRHLLPRLGPHPRRHPPRTVQAKGAPDVLGQDGDRLVLADAITLGSGLTLVDVSTRALTAVRVPAGQSDASGAYLIRGTVYFTRTSGGVSAVSPRTGRALWDSNSTVERPGPPAASATHVYVASPSGRVAALDAVTGKVEGTRSGRDDGGRTDNASGAPLTLVGDALYVPYGERSVYTVDVRDLRTPSPGSGRNGSTGRAPAG